MEILKVENLKFKYENASESLFSDLSFSANEGDILLLCGKTGCGKSTLLKILKHSLLPLGDLDGNIFFFSKNINDTTQKDLFSQIGYVMQRPESQTISDKVWHELAFGLENMGVAKPQMERTIAEVSAYFGISDIFENRISELSGGKRQIVNIASIVAMKPKMILLDEPTSRLDPLARREVISIIERIAKELSITIIIAEHCYDEIIDKCDSIIYLDKNDSKFFNSRQKAVQFMLNTDMNQALPCACKIADALNFSGEIPLNIKSARELLRQYSFKNVYESNLNNKNCNSKKTNTAIEIKDAYFRYEKNAPDILKGASLKIYENEIFCIVGANASGKSTLLNIIAGILKPYCGKVLSFGKKFGGLNSNTAMLYQDALSVFTSDSIAEELKNIDKNSGNLGFDAEKFLDMHPYDLSGGELQLCALYKVFSSGKKLILLDEPTKGLDALEKNRVLQIIRNMKKSGKTIIVVTHDLEFASACADRCTMFFNGGTLTPEVPQEFFAKNAFYTTDFNRITADIVGNVSDIDGLKEAAL